jgi:hypothetical protein
MLSRGCLKVRWLRVGGSMFLVCGQRQIGQKRWRTWRVIPSCSEGDQCPVCTVDGTRRHFALHSCFIPLLKHRELDMTDRVRTLHYSSGSHGAPYAQPTVSLFPPMLTSTTPLSNTPEQSFLLTLSAQEQVQELDQFRSSDERWSMTELRRSSVVRKSSSILINP